MQRGSVGDHQQAVQDCGLRGGEPDGAGGSSPGECHHDQQCQQGEQVAGLDEVLDEIAARQEDEHRQHEQGERHAAHGERLLPVHDAEANKYHGPEHHDSVHDGDPGHLRVEPAEPPAQAKDAGVEAGEFGKVPGEERIERVPLLLGGLYGGRWRRIGTGIARDLFDGIRDVAAMTGREELVDAHHEDHCPHDPEGLVREQRAEVEDNHGGDDDAEVGRRVASAAGC